MLWKLPANGFLLYQRVRRLLLPEQLLIYYTESDKGTQGRPDPHRLGGGQGSM